MILSELREHTMEKALQELSNALSLGAVYLFLFPSYASVCRKC